MTTTDKIYNKVSLSTPESFKYYSRNYKGSPRHKLKKKDPFIKVVNTFWKEMSYLLTESEGGVFIKNLAYFGVMMRYDKAYYFDWMGNKHYNFHTDHYIYHPIMFTNVTKFNHLRCWSMDRTFSTPVRQRIKKNLFKGKRYLLNYTIMNKIHKNQKWFGYRQL